MKKLSSTFLKALSSISEGTACPKRVYATQVAYTHEEESSDAMLLGQFFEALAFGNPFDMTKIKLLKNGELPASFKLAQDNALHVMQDLNYNGLRVIAHNFKVEVGALKAIYDCIAVDENNEAVIVDLKYSGHLDNKWESFGWGDVAKYPQEKAPQPILYAMLLKDALRNLGSDAAIGSPIKFIYYVHSSTSDKRKMLQVDVRFKDADVFALESLVNRDFSEWEQMPSPSLSKCDKCPVKECILRQTSPAIEYAASFSPQIFEHLI